MLSYFECLFNVSDLINYMKYEILAFPLMHFDFIKENDKFTKDRI